MLNKVMMTGRLISEPALTTENGCRCCRISIAVDQPKRKGFDTVGSDIFNCIAHERNADMMNDLFSLGDLITMVGSLRNVPDHSAEIVVQEVHISGGKQAAITGDTGILS